MIHRFSQVRRPMRFLWYLRHFWFILYPRIPILKDESSAEIVKKSTLHTTSPWYSHQKLDTPNFLQVELDMIDQCIPRKSRFGCHEIPIHKKPPVNLGEFHLPIPFSQAKSPRFQHLKPSTLGCIFRHASEIQQENPKCWEKNMWAFFHSFDAFKRQLSRQGRNLRFPWTISSPYPHANYPTDVHPLCWSYHSVCWSKQVVFASKQRICDVLQSLCYIIYIYTIIYIYGYGPKNGYGSFRGDPDVRNEELSASVLIRTLS